MWIKIYFKELAHTIVGDAYAKICKTGQQTRDPKKSWCCGIEFKGNLEAEFSLPWGPQGFPRCLDDKESASNAGDLGAIPGLGRSPGEGSSYPLQYSVLENSMHCVVHRVSKSQTWLSDFHLGSPGFSFESFCQQQTGTYQDHCQRLNNKGICHRLMDIEPHVTIAIDLQQPLRELRVEWGTLYSRESGGTGL